MKKFIILLVIVMIPFGVSAQRWLDRAANRSRQNSQRIVPRTNQQTRQYQQQEFERQQRLYQQRRKTLQQNNYQQQNYNAERIESSKRVASSPPNNQVQGNDKVVTLITSGTGNTKEEAIRNALRSAIEQAFGTFVSSNTEVLNDELIKDEITTVSTGNVKSYKELTVNQSNGIYDVSVQAIVSIDQLTKFAQSKGMQAELAGASFTMNMKMRELNRKNEVNAIDHMIEKAKAIAKNGLFDYKLEIGEPTLINNSQYAIELRVLFCENANTIAFYKTINQTLQALSLSQKEQQEYRNAGLKFIWYNTQLGRYGGDVKYALRNEYPECSKGTRLLPIIVDNALSYIIQDNLGNHFYWLRMRLDDTKTIYDGFYDYVRQEKGLCTWFYIDKELNKTYFWELCPKSEKLYNEKNRNFIGYSFRDWGTNGDVFNATTTFNPTIDQKGNERKVNNPQRIYYYQEFFVLYSEEELSKLNSITINHK